MWIRPSTLCAALLCLALAGSAAADVITANVIRQAHRDLTPAIGHLRYSMEITNPNTGERSRRDRDALLLLVGPDGLGMTHGHMLTENAEPFNISVTLGQGLDEQTYEAELVGKPDDLNVCFVRVVPDTPQTFPYVRFTESRGLGLGTRVAAIGILGETLDYVRAVQEVRVGAVLEEPRTTYVLDDTVRFGYVGAPVIDAQGRAIGVIGFDLSAAEGGDLYVRSGHPLLYHTTLFRHYIDRPEAITERPEEADEAWLGVFTQPLNDDFAEYWGLDKTGGLIISTVVPASPAAAAGFRPGDVVTHFGSTVIRARQDRDVLGFTKLVRETGAGAEVPVRFLRDGEVQDVTVTLGVRPRTAQDADEFEEERFGLTVRELTTDVRIAMNLAEDVQGVIVRRVKSGSIAQLGRMMPGVIIMSFGGHPVTDIASFEEALEKVEAEQPGEVAVFGRFGPAQGFFRLEPRW